MASNREYSVNWKNHMKHVKQAFDNLYTAHDLTDVTLFCEGRSFGAHKLVLSACSPYFYNIFKEVPCQHPVIIMNEVQACVLEKILHFIYQGDVSVDISKLDSFLKTAQVLKISGLTDTKASTESWKDKEEAEHVENEKEGGSEVAAPEADNSSAGQSKNTCQKRTNQGELPQPPGKISRQDSSSTHNVKNEPVELEYTDHVLDDPLQQELQQDEDFTYDDSTASQVFPDEDFGKPAAQGFADEEFKSGPDGRSMSVSFQSHKGGKWLNLNGYKYLVDKIDYAISKVYWRCHRHKKARCGGRLITDLNFNLLRISAPHMHPPVL